MKALSNAKTPEEYLAWITAERLRGNISAREYRYLTYKPNFPQMGVCEHCKQVNVLVFKTSSMRMDDSTDYIMCEECSNIYTDMMEEQWSDYYRGCL